MTFLKLFTPDAGCTRLLMDLDTDEPNVPGLRNLGVGFTETTEEKGRRPTQFNNPPTW